jgi:hypothetical protein
MEEEQEKRDEGVSAALTRRSDSTKNLVEEWQETDLV